MAKDGEFEASYKYMNELTTKANIEAYEKALTDEVKRRVENSKIKIINGIERYLYSNIGYRKIPYI